MSISSECHQQLRDLASAVAAKAYAPYSHFYVGAAILLQSGHMVTGCNVENASYRLTTCAEQSAIANAVAMHGPEIRLVAVVVHNRDNVLCPPCGACRQTIAEFADHAAVVVFPGENGVEVETTIGALLPAAFEFKST